MKSIILCRHAKSDWSQGLSDIERPLNKRGKKDAPKMGKVLAQYGYQADLIISSPANRAKTTAGMISKEIGYLKDIQIDKRIYEEGYGAVFNLIQEIDPAINNIMIFGHNPTFENLSRFLLQSDSSIIMPTSSMLCMDVISPTWKNIEPGRFSLRWFLIPRLIK